MSEPKTYVAFLRAINVAGRNKLPMKELSALFEKAGGRAVRTYLQSGNVVFAATAELARRLPGEVTAGIAERFGFASPIVVRSAAELVDVVERNPYADLDEDPRFIQVGFFDRAPSPEAAARLDPERSPHDRFTVSGREIFAHFPRGTQGSKLSNAYFEKVLGVSCTLRNWRTVKTLAEMVA